MNKKLGILSVLVLAVALTAYSVAGTYAKYTTTESDSDSARVAKWKINELTDVNLFGASYIVGGTQGTTADETIVVAEDGQANIVAPGTKGSYTFAITGETETNYTIAVNATVTDTIGQIVYKLDGGAAMTAAELQTALNNLGKDGENSIVYAANSLNDTDSHEHTITWEWVYDNNVDATDTAKGNAAATATTDENMPSVAIAVQVTATQSNQAATE